MKCVKLMRIVKLGFAMNSNVMSIFGSAMMYWNARMGTHVGDLDWLLVICRLIARNLNVMNLPHVWEGIMFAGMENVFIQQAAE